MMNLQDRLERLAGPAQPATADQIDADLTRGRRALGRRRTAQALGGSVAGIVAVATAFALINPGVAPAPRPSTTSGGAVAGAPAINLVAYRGAQPKGFTVDTVPDGWFVQTDDKYNLLMAPDRAKHPGPNVDPSKAPVFDKRSFVDKIGCYLGSKDMGGPHGGTPVKVGDKNGVLVKSELGETPDGPEPMPADGDTGWQLFVKQPNGVYLIVQFWQGLGMTRDQMITIGAGVHVHKDALRSAG